MIVFKDSETLNMILLYCLVIDSKTSKIILLYCLVIGSKTSNMILLYCFVIAFLCTLFIHSYHMPQLSPSRPSLHIRVLHYMGSSVESVITDNTSS